MAPLIIAPIMLAKLRESPEFERMRSAAGLSGSADARGSFVAIGKGRAGCALRYLHRVLPLLDVYPYRT